MEYHVYTVHDSKAEAYLQPFFFKNDAVALRGFKQLVNQDGHQFNTNPEDYTLVVIGEYDETIGVLKSTDHRAIATGLQVKTHDSE